MTNFANRSWRAPMRTAFRSLVLVAVVGACALSTVSPASAHAIVQSTEPGIDEVVGSAPQRVVMSFSEPVEIALGAVRVYDTTGRRVDRSPAEHLSGDSTTISVGLEDDLPDGTYTVAWRVVSADGHPISEAFVFHIGAPGSRPAGIADEVLGGGTGSGGTAAVFGVVRWTIFGSLLVLVGSVAFVTLVWRRAGRPGIALSSETENAFVLRARALAAWSWGICILATLASLWLQGASAGGLPLLESARFSVLNEVLGTRYGTVALFRIALLIAGAAIALPVVRGRAAPFARPSTPQPASLGAAASTAPLPSWWLVVAVLWGTLLMSTPGLQGHAGTTDPVAFNLAADTIHLLAAAAWIGGLVTLWVVAWPATGSLDETGRFSTLLPVVRRFSTLAGMCVALIIVTGSYRAFNEVGTFGALRDTTYGLTLVVKVGLFGVLVGLGALNRWRLSERRMSRGAGHMSLAALRRTVVVEVAVGVCVVAVTSLLVNLVPAKVEAGLEGPFATRVRIGENNLDVLVDPNETGENSIHLTATTPEGAPARIRAMEVLFAMPSREVGPLEGRGKELSQGHFVVQGNQLSVPGEWQLEIIARPDRFSEERATVSLTVND